MFLVDVRLCKLVVLSIITILEYRKEMKSD